jgi:hypothetical protein
MFDLSKPWARQPFDDDASYVAFQTYLADSRRLAETGERPLPPKVWRLNWEIHAWRQRALAYDAHLNDRIRETHEAEVIDASVRHARIGLRFQALSEKELAKLEKASATDIPAIREGTILRYAERGIAIEREAVGQAPPQRDDLDLSRLTLDELRLFHELAKKASQGR